MSDAGRTRPTRWLLREPTAGTAARLFCIPYSGCGASLFRAWPATYEGVEICAVQLPGRENRMREPVPASYRELGEALAAGLLGYLDRPYGIFGHCGSALTAVETARSIVELGGRAPSAIFVSSQVAPQDGPYGRMLHMNRSELSDVLRGLFDELGTVAPQDILDMTLDVLEQDLELNRRYVTPAPVHVPCPVVAIGWTSDTEVPHELMTGWSVDNDASLHLLEGGHYAFIGAPRELLKLAASRLDPDHHAR